MNWKEKFDKEFPRFKNRAFTEDTADLLKSFIESLLTESRKEALEEVIKDIEEKIYS